MIILEMVYLCIKCYNYAKFSKKRRKKTCIEHKRARFSLKISKQIKTNFTKFELSTTFRSQDKTVEISPLKPFFSLEFLPGLPTTNKTSQTFCQFVTLNSILRSDVVKKKRQNCKLATTFHANSSQLSKS